jgi:hypothetical protein
MMPTDISPAREKRQRLHSMRLLTLLFCLITAAAAISVLITSALGVPFVPPGTIFVTFGTVWTLPAALYVIMAGLIGFYDTLLVTTIFLVYMVPNVLLGLFQFASAIYVVVASAGLTSISLVMALFLTGFTLLFEVLALILVAVLHAKQAEDELPPSTSRRKEEDAENEVEMTPVPSVARRFIVM